MTVTIYGIHPVLEAIKKRPRAFHSMTLSRQAAGSSIKQLISLAEKSNIKVSYDSPKNISRSCQSEQHQGVAATADSFPLTDLKTIVSRRSPGDKHTFFLVADSIQDPHNFGALIRTAVCAGVQAIIFPKDRAAPLTGTVAKASAGAIEHIPLCRVTNLASALEQLKEAGIWIAGTFPHGRESIYDVDFNLDMALVIGNEGKGIRPLIEKKCDFHLSIPLKGSFDSLNASTAGPVVMFEVMRQRNT